jgi:hypothetical protein
VLAARVARWYIFVRKTPQFGYIFGRLGIGNVMVTCLWLFGKNCGHLEIFPLFGMFYNKNLATLLAATFCWFDSLLFFLRRQPLLFLQR